MTDPQTFFATCAPGLEPILHKEIQELKLGKVERQVGGVRFSGKAIDMQRANLWLRTAGRVLMRISRYEAHGSDGLYNGAREVPWETWLKKGATLRVDSQTKDSDLDHSRFIEQRIKDAIVDRVTELGFPRPSVEGEEADLRVHAHLFKDRVTLSLDSSGAALRKRGWRVAQGRAPLSETMAAAMVLHSGWDGKSPLVDPFCGSGTLLVEAALWASRTAPGSFARDFGFQAWADYDAKAWQRLLQEARAGVKPLGKAPILGIDSSSQRVTEAQANLESAGFAGKVTIQKGDARTFEAKRGWNAHIVTNPPYGVRVGDEQQMVPLYMEFAQHLKAVGEGYHLTLLTQPTLVPSLGLPKLTSIPVRNGAIDCVLLKGDL